MVIASSKFTWWICFPKPTTWKRLCTWLDKGSCGQPPQLSCAKEQGLLEGSAGSLDGVLGRMAARSEWRYPGTRGRAVLGRHPRRIQAEWFWEGHGFSRTTQHRTYSGL